LAEKDPLFGRRPNVSDLLALRILLNLDASPPQNHGALDSDHLACEVREQFALIVAHGVRLNQHGLVAVGLFCPSGQAKTAYPEDKEANGTEYFH
jgi:hypothetical protein